MSFPSAYGFLTKRAEPWQSPWGLTLIGHNPRLPKQGSVMDIERINLIGTNLADLTRRTQALRGYL